MAVIRDYLNGQFRDNSSADEVGIGGFSTMSTVSERVIRTRDVPTTYLEDGSQLNDHIIINPLNLSIEGVVSNSFVLPSVAFEAIADASATVGIITQYAQPRTNTELSSLTALGADVFTAIGAADSIINSGQRFASRVGFLGSEGKSNIEKFIDAMEGVMNSDSLIEISAPLRTYRNMAITSLDYDRDNTTDSLNFRIEAQQFRFAETAFSEIKAAKNPATGNNGQQSDQADKGPQSGEQVESFLSENIIGPISGLFSND